MSRHTQIIWLTAWKLADIGSLDNCNTLHSVLRIKIPIVGYTIDFPFPPSGRVLQICIYVERQCATLNIKLIVMPESRGAPLDAGWRLELETKVHPKVRNHGEGSYKGLLLVESAYYFHI